MVIHLSGKVNDHRLGAFVYGFLSGLGFILIVWGVASISWMPSRSPTIFVGITLFGVVLLSVGSCREAYLRGSLSLQLSTIKATKSSRQKATDSNPISKEQNQECLAETHEDIAHEQECQAQI